jgi:phosphatidylinositol alpha-mannosyltransferase
VGETKRSDLLNVHSLSRNVKVKFNGNRMSMPLPAGKRHLRAFLEREKFDVLHVQVPYSPLLAGRLLAVAPRATAVVGTFHILPYSRLVTLANRGLALLNRRSGRRFDARLAVSAPAAEFARQVYGYHAVVLPNPIDTKKYLGASSKSRDLTIVFLGRLVERKGAQHLLAAIAYLCEHHLYTGNFRVYIGGKGELLASLEQYVQAHDLAKIVTFEGFIDEAKKPGFLAQADIAVYPSTSGESFGIVLLEAMAAARGVVLGGDNPGYASVLAPLAQNQLIDPKNTAEFAHTLAAWLDNAAGRQAAATAQKKYVRQYDVVTVGQELVKIYTEALRRRRKMR